jgi:hypothetical protein
MDGWMGGSEWRVGCRASSQQLLLTPLSSCKFSWQQSIEGWQWPCVVLKATVDMLVNIEPRGAQQRAAYAIAAV